jgi:putative tricarboxylic transport membrane protein
MDILSDLGRGFLVALTWQNLLYCFIGTLLGTCIGVLPGVGPLVTIAVLLPMTFGLPPEGALIMLSGIYYGAAYGGSTTAILVNMPGESSSAITCLDGYQMARQGRAGPALAIAAIGSLVAGCIGTLLIALLARPLTSLALSFQAPEYFSLMLMAIVSTAALVRGSLIKGVATGLLGVMVGLVGMDVNSGTSRFSFGIPGLADGIGFVIVAMGLFAFAEIIRNLEYPEARSILSTRITGLMPSRADLKASWAPILRGTTIGAFFGILPGAGQTISSFASYTLEKRLSSDPSRFGEGAIEGVAAPEAANNAAAQCSYIPTLTLGVPGSSTMALMLGALAIQGITPGPQVMTKHPDLFWGLIASMFIGNAILVALNLPLVGLWVSFLKIPYRWLYPIILVFSCIGVFTVQNSVVDVWLAIGFGLLGYAFLKLDCEPAPFVLGFILGPMIEENLRRAMLLSRGDPTIFLTRPISAAFLVATVVFVALMVMPSVRRESIEASS